MNASDIREQMKVVGADGRHIGTVDRVEGDKIKLTKTDSSDGAHHYIAVSDVESVRDGEVCVNNSAQLH